MSKPYLDPSMLAAIRGIADSPETKAMLRIARDQARLLDTSSMRAIARVAEEHFRLAKSTGVLGTIAATTVPSSVLASASELTATISALGLPAFQQPVLGSDLVLYASAFKAANPIDPAILGRVAALGLSMKGAFDLAPYDELHKTLAVQGALGHFAAHNFNNSLFSDAGWGHIIGDFEGLKEAYAGILLDPVSLALPQVADWHFPEIDVAVHARLITAFESADDQVEAVATSLASEAAERAIAEVESISPRLGTKLRSAFRNLGSSDSQAAANACLAIRQVFMALLRRLAPEDRVRPWAKRRDDPALFRKGDPAGETSYQGRILYLSRFDLDERSAYSTFLVQNARSLVTLLSVINGELHDESPDEPAVILTAARVEHLLLRSAAAFGELIICAKAQSLLDERCAT